MKEPGRSRRLASFLPVLLPVAVILALLVFYRLFWLKGREGLVVYCAHDSVYAGSILRDFERRSGIPVRVKFDTEATKSLGLVELLIREKSSPRCDVFWNNELLGTMRLKDEGVLLPYKGPGYERIPVAFRDPEGYWAGFAARLRIYIVNTEKLKADTEQVREALEGDLSGVAIAKPLYGTTRAHYSVLWHLWGEARLRAWHRRWRQRGVCEVMGNAQVKNLVAQGVCDLGLTDSDDFFLAKDEGSPVAALPVRLEDGRVICIPNTVCIIKGTSRASEAQQLVDYLLSEECELALANGKSRQIPLGPVDEDRLPEEVKTLKVWAEAAFPLASLGDARRACLSWLKQEYVQ